MEVLMQIGSNDDSVAVANTEKLKKTFRGKLTPEKMFELYKQGQNLVFSISSKINVKDTIFNNRTDFNIDSLRYIPFSQGDTIQMEAIVKEVLKGLDNQLRINLDAECRASNKYEGLQVGSISAPNNNAGNWE